MSLKCLKTIFMKPIELLNHKLWLFLLFISFTISSQISEKEILNSYKEFSEPPKEIVYVHLNKSTLVKNEMLGFTAYVFDKSKKELSKLTSNLYCVIKNDKNSIVKSQLVKVKNGLTSNGFNIDSTFTSGVYTFKAYTNWMLNFDERNYYEAKFKVITNSKSKSEPSSKPSYNIQILPESGHIVEETFNTVGVVIKNTNGFGLPFAQGKIIDRNNNVVNTFSCNRFGLAKVYLYPKKGNSYTVKVDEYNLTKKIADIKKIGFNMSLKYQNDFVRLTFKTNIASTKILDDKNYFLTIHNGADLKIKSFKFPSKGKEFNQIIKKETLFKGINIFTVFDAESNYPILERLYFNKHDIYNNEVDIIRSSRKRDSIQVYLGTKKKIDTTKINNLSISILPNQTKAYTYESNILSQTYLQPYVKGFIENGAYYFSNNNSKAIDYNLDLLLLTQGWSSYNWKDIFTKPFYKYAFEKGIDVVANVNDKRGFSYVSYPLLENSSQIFKLSSKDKAFKQKALFPYTFESYQVSALTSKNKAIKPKLYVQFYPSSVPTLKNIHFTTPFKTKNDVNIETNYDINNFWNLNKGVEVLNEVVIKTTKEKRRRDSIGKRNFGKIDFFDDRKRSRSITLATYLNSRGFDARDDSGILTIRDQRPNTINNATPLLVLDEVILQDFGFLGRFTLDQVDYIMIDRAGTGYGLRGGAGVIKIKTDPTFALKNRPKKEQMQSYKFPVSFKQNKKFYTPMYETHNSSFFKEMGVIDWKPNLNIDAKGIIKFNVPKLNLDNYLFFIEGVFNDKELISKKLSFKIN